MYMEKALHKISVRALSERIYRSGSLLGAGYGGVSGLDGTRMHQRVFKDLKNEYGEEGVFSEYSLGTTLEYELFTIQISGRADCILEDSSTSSVICLSVLSFSCGSRRYHDHAPLCIFPELSVSREKPCFHTRRSFRILRQHDGTLSFRGNSDK